jgi:hypothetical protein
MNYSILDINQIADIVLEPTMPADATVCFILPKEGDWSSGYTLATRVEGDKKPEKSEEGVLYYSNDDASISDALVLSKNDVAKFVSETPIQSNILDIVHPAAVAFLEERGIRYDLTS